MDPTPTPESTQRSAYRRAVLTAPLWMPSPRWSSRSIAEALGVSQSLVARIWRDGASGSPASSSLAAALGERALTIVGLLIVPSGSCLVLAPAPTTTATATPAPAVPASPSSVRRLRAVLGAELLREGMDDADASEAPETFWAAVAGSGHAGADLVVVASGDVPVPPDGPDQWTVPDERHWQGLLEVLAVLPDASVRERLVDLEGRLREWHQNRPASGGAPFSWVAAGQDQAASPPSVPGGKRREPAEERSLADDIVRAIRRGLAEGTFGTDDEISDRALSRRLGVSRGRIQRALQMLADDGLVTAAAEGSIVVRLPSAADVMETYAARRALGAIAIRAAMRWTPARRAAVSEILDEVRRCAERHDIARTQQMDMEFQDALFRASGLARIPAMLETLTKQTLMFISVIGIRYAFSPARIVEINTSIFEAVRDKDPDRATRSWQTKMDEGVRYMLDQIELLNRGRTATS